MSWLRSAVSKAVEVGNKNNLTRTIRNYTNSVVQHAGQAIAKGAKRLQDQMGGRSFRSVQKSIQRWEEAAVSCRRPERLRDIEKALPHMRLVCEVHIEFYVGGFESSSLQRGVHPNT